MLAYQGDAEDHGAAIAFESPLERAEVTPEGIVLEVGGAEPMRLLAARVVNSAGLHAPDLARRFAGRDGAALPEAYYCKGNYYTLAGRSPFARLIYPVPERAGLGVHVTVDLGGQCRFGPDTEWIDGIDYDVDPARAEVFYAEVRNYWPALPDGALAPGYAGHPPEAGPGRCAGARFRDRRARRRTACRGWSSCSASRARASPRPGRSPARRRGCWACPRWTTSSDAPASAHGPIATASSAGSLQQERDPEQHDIEIETNLRHHGPLLRCEHRAVAPTQLMALQSFTFCEVYHKSGGDFSDRRRL